jgi:hypothetical protein
VAEVEAVLHQRDGLHVADDLLRGLPPLHQHVDLDRLRGAVGDHTGGPDPGQGGQAGLQAGQQAQRGDGHRTSELRDPSVFMPS